MPIFKEFKIGDTVVTSTKFPYNHKYGTIKKYLKRYDMFEIVYENRSEYLVNPYKILRTTVLCA